MSVYKFNLKISVVIIFCSMDMDMDVPAVGNDFERYIPARYIFAVLGSAGIGIVYGLMVTLPIAMMGMLNYSLLSMVNMAVGVYDDLVRIDAVASYYNNIEIIMSKVLNSNKEKPCLNIDHSYKKDLLGPFLWTPEQQGIIISSYFWGYFISQLVGLSGVITFSPKWTMFFGVLINILCTLLTPMLVKLHYFALIILRIMEGFGGGMILPAFNNMSSKWTPPADRRKMKSLVHTCILVGIVVSTALSGILTAKVGWQSAFYVTGGLSVFWCGLWIVWAQDSPQQQPFISIEERNMIITSIEQAPPYSNEIHTIPWRTILPSKPFLAILVAHVCCNWGWYMLLLELPFYLKMVIKLNILQVTMAISVSFLAALLFNTGLGLILNWMQAKNVINTMAARKMATAFATAMPALSLFLLCFIRCDRTASVIVAIVGVMCTGGMFYGFHSNYDDIAPDFADKLMEVTDAIVTLPRLIVPMFVAAMTHGNSKYGYFAVFGVTTFGYAVALITYSMFGTTKLQPWSKHTTNKNATNSNFDSSNNREDDKV